MNAEYISNHIAAFLKRDHRLRREVVYFQFKNGDVQIIVMDESKLPKPDAEKLLKNLEKSCKQKFNYKLKEKPSNW